MFRWDITFLAMIFALNVWADDVAESQQRAEKRYKAFIYKLKEDAADEKLNMLEVDRIKAQRAQRKEMLEKARRDFVAKRDARRKQELSSESRDQILEKELAIEAKQNESRRDQFVKQKEKINRALSTVRQVDPHDEFEVGKNYEDDSGEVEEDDDEGASAEE